MSPIPTKKPSCRRAVMTEMKTKRPVASMAVAWEKTPFGWRSFGLLICTLGMTLFLRRVLERISDAEFAGETFEHREYGRIEAHLAAGIFPPLPFGLARREQPIDFGRTRPAADARRRCRNLLAEKSRLAEMSDVDRNEE